MVTDLYPIKFTFVTTIETVIVRHIFLIETFGKYFA